MKYKMERGEVEDFPLLESTFVKEEIDLEYNEKEEETISISAGNSITIKQEIDLEEEEGLCLFESIVSKEETNLEENEEERQVSPFGSVIIKKETSDAEDAEECEEGIEETEQSALGVACSSTIKQEIDIKQEEVLFPFERVFVKEEREEREEKEGEEIYGYNDDQKTEDNDGVRESLTGAVEDANSKTNVAGDVAQRMRARFRSILFRRVPSTSAAASAGNPANPSALCSGLVQTKSQPPRGGPFQCGECEMGFKHEHSMWMHEFACKENAAVSRAEALKWSECPQCPALLPPGVLADHLSLHSDHLFCCDVCGMVFFSLPKLVTHKTQHDKLHLRFRCGDCGRAFPLLSSLRRHQHRHTMECPIAKCPQCPKSFRYSWILRRHRLAHTKKKTIERMKKMKESKKDE